MGYQVCDKRTLEPCDSLSPACLGGGAFGKAYAAVNTVEGDHYYAVKVVDIHQAVVRHETTERRILKEVLLMKTLQHPNVVRYFPANRSADRDRRYLFIPMELCAGSLLEVVRQGPVLADTLRQYMSELAAGFRYLHDVKKLVHRDVKADNILLGRDGVVRVGDLGLAARAGATAEESALMLTASSFKSLELQRGHVV